MLRGRLGGVGLVNLLLIRLRLRLRLLLIIRIRRLRGHLRLRLRVADVCLRCTLRACRSLLGILIRAVCVLVLFSHGDHSLSLANLALFTLHSITQAP